MMQAIPELPKEDESMYLEESHYQRLSTIGRSNLYSLASPSDKPNNNIRFILAGLSDGVYIIQEEDEEWKTLFEPVDEGEGFISLDSIYCSQTEIVICYAKANLENLNYSLNFAKLRVNKLDNKQPSFIDVVDRYCLPLEATALKITHINYNNSIASNLTFIVCSSEQTVSSYSQIKDKNFEFEQVSFEDKFPELKFFTKLKSNILAIAFHIVKDDIYVAVGCQDGTLVSTSIKLDSNNQSYKSMFYIHTTIYYPVSSLSFFTQFEEISLLVTTAVNVAIVYKDVHLKNNIKIEVPFEGDTVLCGTIADINLDGTLEIVLGTYNQHLLVYKLEDQQYKLDYERKLPYPVYGVLNWDFDLDGLNELVVLTMYGLHVMKPNLALAKRRILSYLDYIKKNYEVSKVTI